MMRRIAGALIIFAVAVVPKIDDISHAWIPVRRAQRAPAAAAPPASASSPAPLFASGSPPRPPSDRPDSTSAAASARTRRDRARGTVPAEYCRDPLLFLSRAPTDSLVLLPGIGPVLAERISNARTGKRSFTRWDDLLGIKGIGPKTIERLKKLADGAKSH